VNRRTVILLLLVLAVTLAAAVTYALLPKHYQLGEHMAQTTAFWNNDEAFFFLAIQVTGRSTNFIQEKLSRSPFAAPLLLVGWNDMFYKQDLIAYHLQPSDKLDRFAMPPNTAVSGSWSLRDGKLQLVPAVAADQPQTGFRWDGQKFVPLPATKAQQQPAENVGEQLAEDDLDDEDSEYSRFIEKPERQKFRQSGWHVKVLNGYAGKGNGATLPMDLGKNHFRLILHSFPFSVDSATFGSLVMGARSVEVSSDRPAQPAEVLWNQVGWREIPKTEYQKLAQQYSRRTQLPGVPWLWLVALLGLFVWKFARWGNLLFSFGRAKRRVLKYLPTGYSFPPASPGQFPALDSAALDRYTRDFDTLGFTPLIDFSLTADTPAHPANFCRLMVHSRNHCFAEMSQFFPQRKAPLPLKCSVNGALQDGWTITLTNRKPQAASSLVRRPKAIVVSAPEANPSELLQSFLKMRDQVCVDLGISPSKEDTLEAYISRLRNSASEMRETVRRKNFALGTWQVYYRKLSLLKTRPEYVWLGDYPKIAAQRKQSYAVPVM
jgi:hypothetical protein